MSQDNNIENGQIDGDELKKQDAEEPTTGAVPDGPSRSDQVGEKPLIAPGKSEGL